MYRLCQAINNNKQLTRNVFYPAFGVSNIDESVIDSSTRLEQQPDALILKQYAH